MTPRLFKALRNAERSAYPDWDATSTLVVQGYLAIITDPSHIKTITITDRGQEALREWSERNEVRI